MMEIGIDMHRSCVHYSITIWMCLIAMQITNMKEKPQWVSTISISLVTIVMGNGRE